MGRVVLLQRVTEFPFAVNAMLDMMRDRDLFTYTLDGLTGISFEERKTASRLA